MFKAVWLLCVMLLLNMTIAHAQQKPAPAFKLFFENVFLHTDRGLYAAGDTLWYKAYLTDAQTGKLSHASGNLYVEVIAPADTLVSRQIIQLTGGLGNGDFSLPDSLITGTYRLRAYTNWMRNFGDAFIFEQTLSIIGDEPDKNATAKAMKQVSAKVTKPVMLPVVNAIPAPPFTIRFYPEGGSLIKGLASMVAIKAEDNGSTANLSTIKGSIYNHAGDTVSRFRCDSMGNALVSLLALDTQPFGLPFITVKNL